MWGKHQDFDITFLTGLISMGAHCCASNCMNRNIRFKIRFVLEQTTQNSFTNSHLTHYAALLHKHGHRIMNTLYRSCDISAPCSTVTTAVKTRVVIGQWKYATRTFRKI